MARLTPRAYPEYSRLCETWVVCVSYYGLALKSSKSNLGRCANKAVRQQT